VEGDIRTELVPVLDGVRHCLRWRRDLESDSTNGGLDDAEREDLARPPGDLERWPIEPGAACFAIYREPDLRGVLIGKIVKAERREQTEHAVGYSSGHLDQSLGLTDLALG
jgi:hypothetical protein